MVLFKKNTSSLIFVLLTRNYYSSENKKSCRRFVEIKPCNFGYLVPHYISRGSHEPRASFGSGSRQSLVVVVSITSVYHHAVIRCPDIAVRWLENKLIIIIIMTAVKEMFQWYCSNTVLNQWARAQRFDEFYFHFSLCSLTIFIYIFSLGKKKTR